MYTYTRQDAAEFLWVSTRSVDRYVKAWRIRSEKRGKIIYLHSDDLNNLNSKSTKQELIVEKKESPFKTQALKKTEASVISNKTSALALGKVYDDLREEVKDKDKLITELSIRVWQAEEVVKNSVSLIEYKKSQLLLEESRSHLNQAIIDLENEKEDLKKDLKHQRANNIIMLLALVALFAIAGALFLINI